MAGDDFRPTASRAALERRAELARRLRAFFDGRGYLEVETPLLSADTVVDRHIDPVVVPAPRGGALRYLQTSPEFAMKRMVASGFEAVYQLTRAFREGEVGTLHNPEFTIAEWYRVGDGVEAQLDLLDALGEALLRDRPGDAGATWPAERLTYRDACVRYAGIDPFEARDEDLVALARERDVAAPDSLSPADRDGWLQLLMGELVEPRLGVGRAVLLHDYPASQAALSRVRPGDPSVAERFELYVDGLELANGFHELLDPDELARRNAEHNRQRLADGKHALPEESRLLDAMRAGLPACAGVALGFDRVAMLATASASIADVIAFPAARA